MNTILISVLVGLCSGVVGVLIGACLLAPKVTALVESEKLKLEAWCQAEKEKIAAERAKIIAKL